MIIRRDSRHRPEPDTGAMPPRPPEGRPAAADPWLFGASHNRPRGMEGDPCGAGPVEDSSDDGEVS